MKFKNRKKSVANRVLISNWSRKNHRSTKLYYTDQIEFKRTKKKILIEHNSGIE